MSQWRDLDSRPADYKSAALARLSYIGMTYASRLADLKCSQNYPSTSNHFNNHKIWKISMKIKYIKPQKLKVLIALFFGTAGMGIFMGLYIAEGIQSLYITLLGVINLCLGGLVAYLLMTQKPRVRDSRKYKRVSKWNS